MQRVQHALIPLGLAGVIAAAAVGMSLKGAIAQDVAPRQSPRIATADVLGVVERMVKSDRYRPAQEAFTSEQNNKLKPLADELVALEKKGTTLAPGSPDLAELSRQFEEKRDEFTRARQEAMTKIDAFNTDQIREAYRLVLQSVDDMAAHLGYSHVLASRTGAPVIRSDNVSGALQEILARPVAHGDPQDDLTERLIHEFKLENIKLDDTAARPGPTGTSAPANTPAPSPLPPPPRR
jgi:hypothetical protein